MTSRRKLKVRMRLKEIEIAIETGRKRELLSNMFVLEKTNNKKGRENNRNVRGVLNALNNLGGVFPIVFLATLIGPVPSEFLSFY